MGCSTLEYGFTRTVVKMEWRLKSGVESFPSDIYEAVLAKSAYRSTYAPMGTYHLHLAPLSPHKLTHHSMLQ